MKAFATIALVLIGTANAAADPLPKSEWAYQAVAAVDMMQTLDIKNHSDIHEYNPILGSHPSDKAIVTYFVGTNLAHAGITKFLQAHGWSDRQIAIWEYTSIGIESIVVAHNFKIGLQVRF